MTKSDVDSSSGSASESTDSRVKHSNKWKERKEERKEKREEWKKEVGERKEQRKKEWEEKKEERKKEKEEKKKHKDHKSGHSDTSFPHSGGLVSSHHLMTQSEQHHFGSGSGVGGYHYPEHTQQYGHHGGGEHGGLHQQSTPPPYVEQNQPPPSGYRVPLTTQTVFPIDPNQTGPPAFIDADGISPIFVGSALMENSVHPCKIGPHLNPFTSVPYGGGEFGHQGRFDLLPFRHDQMEWVRTSAGRIPRGRRAIEGGYEEDGNKLYHAVAVVSGVKVPGKTGEHLTGARVPFGGIEHEIYDDYEILCWR